MPANELDDLYRVGLQRQSWEGVKDCATKLGVNRGTIQIYRKGPPAESRKRARKAYNALVEKMRKIVGKQEGKAPKGKPSDPIPPPNAVNGDWANLLLAGIRGLLAEAASTPNDQPAEPARKGSGKAKDVDARIAGPKGPTDGDDANGMRFVLTAESFVPLLARFSKRETGDTIALIRDVLVPGIVELRRRLTLSTQMDDLESRTRFVQALGEQFDELTLAFEHSKEVVPMGAFDLIEERRERLSALRQQH